MYIKLKTFFKDLFIISFFIIVYYILLLNLTDGLLLFSSMILLKIRSNLKTIYPIIKRNLKPNNKVMYILFQLDPFLLEFFGIIIDFIFFILFNLIEVLLKDFVWLFLIFIFHLIYICISQIIKILKKYKIFKS